MFDFLTQATQQEKEAVQGEFIENVQRAAAGFTTAVASFTLDAQGRGAPYSAGLDYSVSSLVLLDHIVERVRAKEVTLRPMQTIGISAYIYEVARRHHSGLYEVCDDDDPVVLVTGEPEFDVCLCAISFINSRLAGEADEPLSTFFDRYVAAVNARASVIIR